VRFAEAVLRCTDARVTHEPEEDGLHVQSTSQLIVTYSGIGGYGKTYVAMEYASQVMCVVDRCAGTTH
jgi:hypothetical protein